MKPYIICHMGISLDGGLHPSRFTSSPDGPKSSWSSAYERIHADFKANAWLVGRVTMAEMSRAKKPEAVQTIAVDRHLHIGDPKATSFAIATDKEGKLHFAKPDIGGDHVIVLLGNNVSDAHLSELVSAGVSYIVSEQPDLQLNSMLKTVNQRFGVEKLMLEGGAVTNGTFFAAGMVDELSLLISPAIHGQTQHEAFVTYGTEGLAGKVELSLSTFKVLENGMIHLRYAVRQARNTD